MEDLLIRLERQIRSLLDQQDQLRQSNHHLQHTQGSLAREKEVLLTRQEKAIHTIEALVSRLKAIEKTS